MVLLCDGTPLDFEQSRIHFASLRRAALTQCVQCLRCDARTDGTRWGDEIEYAVVDEKKGDPLALPPRVVAPLLATGHWMPEYGVWMLESIPSEPYVGVEDVLRSMAARRAELQWAVASLGGRVVTLGACPTLGANSQDVQDGDDDATQPVTHSTHFPDYLIAPLPRFTALTANIRARRGTKVCIPIDAPGARPLDAMGFGMGCCSLQITLQATDLAHALELHDAFVTISPLFLALSAATPVVAGAVRDEYDSRWPLICDATDDRTPEERAMGWPSRFDTAPWYLSERREALQDPDIVAAHDADAFDTLRRVEGVPEPLARWLAHALALDPLVVFAHHADADDPQCDALRTFLSTQWKSVRLKVPTPDEATTLGWRVEFRVMDVQPTDADNAAFAIAAMAAARALVADGAVPRTPMAVVRADLAAAGRRGAARNGRFAWGTGDARDAVALVRELRRRSLPHCPNADAAFARLESLAATGETAATRMRARIAATGAIAAAYGDGGVVA